MTTPAPTPTPRWTRGGPKPAAPARLYGDLARPDGYGRWHEAGREVEFFLEYDTGTEPLTRVAAKLDDYHRLATATGITTPILFWFPTTDREAHARDALGTTLRMLERPETVPIATTHHTAGQTAPTTTTTPVTAPAVADARWAPIGPCGGTPARTRLVVLPDVWARDRLPRTTPALAPTAPAQEGGRREDTETWGQSGPDRDLEPPPDRAAPPDPTPDP